MTPAARRMVDALAQHTPFAEAIVRRQCERAGLSADDLSESDFVRVAKAVCIATAMFVDPPAMKAIKRALKLE